jgi:hypothetical protein
MLQFSGLRSPVRIGFLEAAIVEVLNQAAVWSARYGKDVIITSMNDHTHSTGSFHYKNLAVDLQVRAAEDPFKPGMVLLDQHLRATLGLGYDVVFNSPGHMNHIHVEWDIRQRDPLGRTAT